MPRVLIVGLGFLGTAIARRFRDAGWRVCGVTRCAGAASDDSFEQISCDVTDAQAARAALKPGADAVVFAASSNRGGTDAYRRIFLNGLKNVLACAAGERVLFTSSTSVYAQTSGEWVDEQSDTLPARETGRILLEAERMVLDRGGCVTRLSGLYGPGRSVYLQRYLEGIATIEGDGGRWINQIHRDDAAAAVAHLVTARASGVYNVSDDTPMRQLALYEMLATQLHGALPPEVPIDPNRKRAWTSKRIRNARLRATGWHCDFPSYAVALARYGRSLLDQE